MRRVVVIGAGLGGLAASIRLAHAGFRVTLLEKNERVGGKMGLWEKGGYRFDTGPSLLTMPFVLRELFALTGERLEDFLDLVPLEPICRYSWPDGASLDASGDIAVTAREMERLCSHDSANVRRFLQHGKKIYDAALDPFLLSPFGSLRFRDIIRNLRHLPAVSRIDSLRSLSQAVEGYFVDARIRQLFNRFATYNGSSPYLAPATLCIIPYIEFAQGGWYVRGGMYSLACALERLARSLGVEIRTNVAATRIERRGRRAKAVVANASEEIPADIIISNADAQYVEKELLGDVTVARPSEPSLSGFVLLLGLKKGWPQLGHHTVFFSENYRSEFDVMINERRLAENPTIYVCNTSFTDPAHAPAGCSNLFVLVNAPPLSIGGDGRPVVDWRKETVGYRDLVVSRLESRGLTGLADTIDVERVITPMDFEREYNAIRGSIYGRSSNSRWAAFLRPPNRSRRYDNLYFVGGSSHPGGGVPLVLLSGRIVADMIQREHKI